MEEHVGIWIDHRKAFIVSIKEDCEDIMCMKSKVEGHIRLSGGSRTKTPYGPQEVASERKIQERRRHQLHQYYQEVIRAIGCARKILIFGPGEAKNELEKEMRKSKEVASRIVGVERSDKMTERQIAAKVRSFFLSQG